MPPRGDRISAQTSGALPDVKQDHSGTTVLTWHIPTPNWSRYLDLILILLFADYLILFV